MEMLIIAWMQFVRAKWRQIALGSPREILEDENQTSPHLANIFIYTFLIRIKWDFMAN